MPALPTQLSARPIDGIHQLPCPACGDTTLSVERHEMWTPRGGYFCTDGDTIFGVWERLSEAQRQPSTFRLDLSVGQCPHCWARHFTVGTNLIHSAAQEDSEEHRQLVEHLYGCVEPQGQENFICEISEPIEGLPRQWLLEETWTPQGPMHEHTFGPFALGNPSEVEGPCGVSACSGSGGGAWKFGGDLLVAMWDSLRAFNRAGYVRRQIKAA